MYRNGPLTILPHNAGMNDFYKRVFHLSWHAINENTENDYKTLDEQMAERTLQAIETYKVCKKNPPTEVEIQVLSYSFTL